jgi:CubicO group peptidase (beta-lactamase class C family)
VTGWDELAVRASEERERWKVPGLALALLADGRVERGAWGVASLASGEPLAPDVVFRIASITKPFTATLAMTAVRDGLLDLDEPLPGVAASCRQLLSHTGGLACEWPAPLDPYGDGDDALLRLAEGEPERLPTGPGEEYSYCNVGYWLAAAAIVRATGGTFEATMRERVLEPLGLERTGFEPADRPAAGHAVDPGGDEHRQWQDAYPRVRRPSGGLWSNVDDLLRFASHHLGGSGPLPDELRSEMQTRQTSSGRALYGLGWMLRKANSRRVVEHWGGIPGYNTLLTLVPDEGLALAALTNSGRGRGAIRGILEQLGLAVEIPEPVELPAERLAAAAGAYRTLGGEVVLTPAGGALRVDAVEVDPFSGERLELPPLRAVPVSADELVVVDESEFRGDRIELLRPELVRVGGLVFERVE